jgi:SSS family solute:Na+ symporter/sodium/pantothenate symporter
MALMLTSDLPLGSWISGLILAAPFGAIMATVSSYLLVIASGLVRDVYQRFVNPAATEHELRRLTYVVMIAIGAVAVVLNIFPVKHLQTLVVFSSGCAASAFLIPTVMMCYWRRATAAGTIAAMLAGPRRCRSTSPVSYRLFQGSHRSSAYNLLGFEPLIWGRASLVAGWWCSSQTRRTRSWLELFDADC